MLLYSLDEICDDIKNKSKEIVDKIVGDTINKNICLLRSMMYLLGQQKPLYMISKKFLVYPDAL